MKKSAFVLPLLLFGCFGHGTYQSARTLGEGRHEVSVTTDGIGAFGDDPGGLLQLSGAWRYGLTSGVDVGGGFGTDGIELFGKFALVEEGPVRLALAPDLGGVPFAPGEYFVHTQVPLLVGFPLGEHELTLGGHLGLWAFDFDFFGRTRGAALTTAVSVGGTIALGEVVRLVPGFTLIYPAAAFRKGESVLNDSFLLVEGGVSVQFVFGG